MGTDTSSKKIQHYGEGDEGSLSADEGFTQLESLINQIEEDKLRRDNVDAERTKQLKEIMEKSSTRKKQKSDTCKKENGNIV